MFIAILTLLSALSISGVAIFYSVIGLATIFPGAYWPVIIMGSVLEVGKLITASWLYRQWKFTPFLLKSYLTIAVVVLSLITSMGIFGFLSKAHLEQNLAGDTLVQRVNIINDKIESQTVYIERQKAVITRAEKAIDRTGKDFSQDIAVQENIINSAYARLEVLDADVKAYTDQGRGFFKGDNIKKGVELRKQQKPERDKLNAEIEEAKTLIQKYRDQSRQGGDNNKVIIETAEDNIIKAQNTIDDLIITRQPLEKKLINLEAEIGPVKYIAALAVDWGVTDKVDTSEAVRWVILIIICVFDPLAVLLLIAANQSFMRRFPPKPPKPQEIIDLEKPDDDGIILELKQASANKKTSDHIEKQIKDWQEKLKKFNEKAPKPTDKPVEVIVEQPKKEPTKEEKIQAFDERLRAEEAELERVAAETKADIERIEKNSEPQEYNFEDEIAYDVESMDKPKPELYDKEKEEPTISEQIEEAMEGVQTRIKPDLTEVIEPETHKPPKRGVLGGVMVDKGKVVKPIKKWVDIVIKDNKKTIVPKETYKQNSEQEQSGNWSKINEKRIIDEEQYRQKIESRINDLIIKVKTGEMSIEDLSEEDQKIVKQAMDDGNN
tara:strand:- start:22 stop:1842 length:1821 start_codon:yes stop_codon:yes gene_type:complete